MCKPNLCATCVNAEVPKINYPCRQCMSENDRHDYFEYDTDSLKMTSPDSNIVTDSSQKNPIRNLKSRRQVDDCLSYWEEKLQLDCYAVISENAIDYSEYDLLSSLIYHVYKRDNVKIDCVIARSVAKILLSVKYDLPYSYF